MAIGKSNPRDPSERVGLVLSLVFHLILLGFIIISPSSPPLAPSVVTVTIEPSSVLTKQPQIVSQSDSKPRQSPPPPNTLKLSDSDSATEREQVKRGDSGGRLQSPSNKEQQQQRQSPPRKELERPSQSQKRPSQEPDQGAKPLPSIKDLKLDDATLQARFGKEQNPAQKPAPEEQRNTDSSSSYAAFSRPPGSGAAFLGSGGINDHLPNLPDGDITLLNAKANTYAGFVRRVAVQVFGQLRAQGWERLSMREVQAMNRATTIEAILSPQGDFLRANVIEASGSPAFDTVVNLSVSQGARDPNPPPGARASDGLIHFIFKARSWSQIGADRRSGAPVEHRWLLLATGLE
jgi:hypothetical protein